MNGLICAFTIGSKLNKSSIGRPRYQHMEFDVVLIRHYSQRASRKRQVSMPVMIPSQVWFLLNDHPSLFV